MTEKEKHRFDDYPVLDMVDTVALWGSCYGSFCKEGGSDSEAAQEAKKYLDLALTALKEKIKKLERAAKVGNKTLELIKLITEEQSNENVQD